MGISQILKFITCKTKKIKIDNVNFIVVVQICCYNMLNTMIYI